MLQRILPMFFFAILASAAPVFGEGNLAKRAERLDPLLLNAAEGFSIKTYEIETGQFYRWRIVSDGDLFQ